MVNVATDFLVILCLITAEQLKWNFLKFSTLFLFPKIHKNSNRQNRSDLCLVNHDLHWLKFLISVVERPDNGFRIHHHHVFIPFLFGLDRYLASQTSPRGFVSSVGDSTRSESTWGHHWPFETTIDHFGE